MVQEWLSSPLMQTPAAPVSDQRAVGQADTWSASGLLRLAVKHRCSPLTSQRMCSLSLNRGARPDVHVVTHSLIRTVKGKVHVCPPPALGNTERQLTL